MSSSFANSGSVDERDAQSVEIDRLGHQVARRAWHVGHDGARGADQRVEEARLSNVGPADNRYLEPFAHETPAPRVSEQHRRA